MRYNRQDDKLNRCCNRQGRIQDFNLGGKVRGCGGLPQWSSGAKPWYGVWGTVFQKPNPSFLCIKNEFLFSVMHKILCVECISATCLSHYRQSLFCVWWRKGAVRPPLNYAPDRNKTNITNHYHRCEGNLWMTLPTQWFCKPAEKNTLLITKKNL